MLDFEGKTLDFIKRHALLQRGDMVVAAVSGGPDSMAMLDFLVRRKSHFGINVAVAHVDHMLRGEESKQDLEYVKAYCEKNGLIFKATAINIKNKMEQEQKGMQETARKYRYLFFSEVMKEVNANKLAVAQHGDDQIETILMRLTRGSSGSARAGIQPERPFAQGVIIRPLLGTTKEQIEEYCKANHLLPRIDPSNEKPAYTRNRFRLDVLPALKRENQLVHEQFQHFSEDLLEDEAYLEALAEREISAAARFKNGEIQLDIPSFLQMPLPLQRRGIHLILSYLYKKKITHLTSWHVRLIERLLRGGNPSEKLDLPLRLKVIRSYNQCLFTFKSIEQDQAYQYELEVGDGVSLPDGSEIRLEAITASLDKRKNGLIFNDKDLELPLIIRTRKPGDRIRMKGASGTKKIKDLFIDEKIPHSKRDAWPIITDQKGNVVWVPGLKKSLYDVEIQHNKNQYILYYTTSGGQQN